MADAGPALPAEVEGVREGTKVLLKRASQEFHETNEVPMVTKGVIYLPPEASGKKRREKADDGSTEAGSSDDENENHASQSTVTLGPTPMHLNDFLDMEGPLREGEESGVQFGLHEGLDRSWKFDVPWHAKILSDDFLNKKVTTPDGKVKPRRGVPSIKASDLLNGLVKIDGNWVFPAQINQWPALTGFMLVSITKKSTGMLGMTASITRIWTAAEGKKGKALPTKEELGKCRATFWAPTWSSIGWAPDSPGFVFWMSEMHGDRRPRFLYGSKMIDVLDTDEDPAATITKIHVYAHRYPVAKETTFDRQNYHTLALIEWSHGKYTTLAELAYLNAVGGYGGKTNWQEDKLEPDNKCFTIMNEVCPGGIQPWDESRSEIRIWDMPCKNPAEFEEYLDKYSEKSGLPLAEQRFWHWEKFLSGKLKLRTCTASMMAGFLLNYIQRVWGYSQLRYNCQTFCADFYSFMTGTQGVEPYSAVVRPLYNQHVMSFIYQPTPGKIYSADVKQGTAAAAEGAA